MLLALVSTLVTPHNLLAAVVDHSKKRRTGQDIQVSNSCCFGDRSFAMCLPVSVARRNVAQLEEELRTCAKRCAALWSSVCDQACCRTKRSSSEGWSGRRGQMSKCC